MQYHRRFALWLILAVLLFTSLSLNAQELPILSIAVLDEPRGELMDGARLAVREINSAGGITVDPETNVLLDLIPVSSSALDNNEGVIATLRAQDVIAVLGPVNSDLAISLLPSLIGLGVPIITPATGDTLLTSDASGLVFRSRASDLVQGQALANYLIAQLGQTRIATAQLDIASTAQLLSFATAAAALGLAPSPPVFVSDQEQVEDGAQRLIATDPEVIIAYGSLASATELYTALRAEGWLGTFVYPDATGFTLGLSDEEAEGVLGVSTWEYSATDSISTGFVNLYVRTYNEVPGPIAAAGADSIRLIAQALILPDDLRANLLALSETRGVQGLLNPSALSNGETSTNVVITRLNEFGALQVLASYRNGALLEAQPEIPTSTPTPEITETSVTILSERQNVRGGPSMDYPILGQLLRGERALVVGRSIDNEWVVIEYLGDPGWLAVDLLELTGSLDDIPVIAPPTIPTPVVTPTPTAAPEADVIIVSAVPNPSPILLGQPFVINVTVSNIGQSPTGTFTVAGTFAPNNVFLSGLVPALAPGQSLTVSLNGIFNNSGTFTSSLIVDANNQVNEGAVGEQNNIYNLTYTVDRRILRQASQTLNLGDTLDLEGNAAQGDANWNADGGLALDILFGARLGILAGVDINAITFDSINPAQVNRESIPRTEMFPGTLIGIITADGNRGVMRVDSVTDTQLTLTFRVYANF